MKNKIQKTMERGLEEFTDKFFLVGHPVTGFQKADAKIALKAHQKALLEAVLEELKNRELNTLGINGKDIIENVNYNQALQDIETIINKAIGV